MEAGKDTRGKLVMAAAAEFGDHGYSGTDTNKIARRAGFAPQTFYRSFKDKTDIFLAVYRVWEEEERALLRRLVTEEAPADALIDAAIDHHRTHLMFRRSLRRLALEEPQVRSARAVDRRSQIAQIKRWAPASGALDDGWIASAVLTLERLTDAVAEGEFAEIGAQDVAPRIVMTRILIGLRTGEL